jgi:hypothetical protein
MKTLGHQDPPHEPESKLGAGIPNRFDKQKPVGEIRKHGRPVLGAGGNELQVAGFVVAMI